MKDQLYLIKRGDNQFVEETDVVLKASGGNIGVGSHVPSSKFDVDGKATFKAVNVNDILNVDSDGKVGDIAPQEDDIIVWDGTKWKAGVNAGGIIGGSAVVTSLNAGSSNYTVNFPDTYSAVPAIATDLSIQGEGPIIPYTIANITTSGYDVIFAQPLPNNNYSIHTVFGGNVVLDTGEISGSASDWEAAGLSKIYYVGSVGIGTTNPSDGLLHLRQSSNDAIRLERSGSGANDGNIYLGHSGGGFGISTTGAIGVTVPDLFIDPQGNVGIGTANPDAKLELGDTANKSVAMRFRHKSSNDAYGALTELKSIGSDRTYGTDFTITNRDVSGVFMERLRIDWRGNVGIGTTDPDVKLHLAGNASAIIRLENTDLAIPANRIIGGLEFEKQDPSAPGAGVVGGLRMYSEDLHGQTTYLALSTTSITSLDNEAMRIDSNGNVGIGTTSPDARLEVKSGVNALPQSDISADTGTALRILGNDAAAIDFGSTGRTNNGGVGQWIQARHSEVDSTYYSLLLNPLGGNVGIGTTNPGSKLEVVELLTTTREVLYPLVLKAVDPEDYNQDTNDGIGIKFMLADNGGSLNPADPSSFVGAAIAAKRGQPADDASATDLTFSVSQNDQTLDEAMRITSDGNVGIGTTIPDAKLHINGGALNNQVIFESTDGVSSVLFKDPSGTAEFGNKGNAAIIMPAGVEKMRITSNGKVGIGTNDPKVIHHISTEIDSTNYAVTRFSADNQQFDVGVGGSTAAITGIRNKFYIFDSKLSQTRLVMDSAGNVSIGTSDTGGQLYVKSAASSQTCRLYRSTNTSTARVFDILSNSGGTNTVQFLVNADGVTQNKTGTISQISSDERLKENISDANPKLQDLLKLKVKNFNFSDDENKTKYIGFVAQEMEEVFPSLVMTKDTREYDEDGNLLSGLEDSKSTKVSMDFAILTKAIQEQQSLIEDLKSQNESLIQRIENLENK